MDLSSRLFQAQVLQTIEYRSNYQGSRMSRWIRLILGCVIFCFLFPITFANAQSLDAKHILIIFEQQEATPAYSELEQSFRTVLSESLDTTPEIYREVLDIGRFPGLEAEAIQWIKRKYRGHRIDLVLYVGNSAVEVIPDIPTIYCGNEISLRKSHRERIAKDVIVPLSLNIPNTIKVLTKLHPNVHKLYLISSGKASVFREEALHQILLFKSSLQFEDLSGLEFSQIEEKLSREGADALVLFLGYQRDRRGGVHLSNDVLSELVAKSESPIYGVSDTFIGTGVVGGYVINWKKVGAEAAEVANVMLHGGDGASVVHRSWQEWQFDHRQLVRWGIKPEDLPPGAVVLFRTEGAAKIAKWEPGLVGAGVVGMLLLNVFLLRRQYRYARVEKQYLEKGSNFLQLMEEERRQISRQLHTRITEDLVGISLCVRQTRTQYAEQETGRLLLDEAYDLSHKALQELRRETLLLDPPSLNGQELVPALQSYFSEVTKHSSFTIHAEMKETGVLPSAVADVLYRVVLEQLHHIIRRDQADTISVHLEKKMGNLNLAIEDNGWRTQATTDGERQGTSVLDLGLAGLREQLREWDGELRMQTSSTRTTIRVTIPVGSD